MVKYLHFHGVILQISVTNRTWWIRIKWTAFICDIIHRSIFLSRQLWYKLIISVQLCSLFLANKLRKYCRWNCMLEVNWLLSMEPAQGLPTTYCVGVFLRAYVVHTSYLDPLHKDIRILRSLLYSIEQYLEIALCRSDFSEDWMLANTTARYSVYSSWCILVYKIKNGHFKYLPPSSVAPHPDIQHIFPAGKCSPKLGRQIGSIRPIWRDIISL